ncbi:NADH dehydrogenase I chain F [Salmonella bongori]|nr:NADH dehydrogenase I chain F [Salmonella bongori]
MKNIIRTPETHPLTWRLRDDKQPVWLDEYRSKNGYEGARKALTGLSPDEIVSPGERRRSERARRRGLFHRSQVESDAERRIHEHPLPAV